MVIKSPAYVGLVAVEVPAGHTSLPVASQYDSTKFCGYTAFARIVPTGRVSYITVKEITVLFLAFSITTC
jgi:hypothetical protein